MIREFTELVRQQTDAFNHGTEQDRIAIYQKIQALQEQRRKENHG